MGERSAMRLRPVLCVILVGVCAGVVHGGEEITLELDKPVSTHAGLTVRVTSLGHEHGKPAPGRKGGGTTALYELSLTQREIVQRLPFHVSGGEPLAGYAEWIAYGHMFQLWPNRGETFRLALTYSERKPLSDQELVREGTALAERRARADGCRGGMMTSGLRGLGGPGTFEYSVLNDDATVVICSYVIGVYSKTVFPIVRKKRR